MFKSKAIPLVAAALMVAPSAQASMPDIFAVEWRSAPVNALHPVFGFDLDLDLRRLDELEDDWDDDDDWDEDRDDDDWEDEWEDDLEDELEDDWDDDDWDDDELFGPGGVF